MVDSPLMARLAVGSLASADRSSLNPSLLVIDDQPGTLDTYSRILRLAGYDVATAASGRAGLHLLLTGKLDPRLVLLDLRLPDLSGLEVLAEVREFKPRLRVVMMSMYGTTAVAAAARELGAVDFVDKRLDPGPLVDAVRKTLDRPRPARPDVARRLGFAAVRWANAVLEVSEIWADVATIEQWGSTINTTASALKAWCAAAGVTAGDSLDFARALRIVRQHAGRTCDWYNVLAIVDSRTMERFLERAGLTMKDSLPDVETFLLNQHFITKPVLLTAARKLLGLSLG
jgi:DNA-binding response OmpR family regulator